MFIKIFEDQRYSVSTCVGQGKWKDLETQIGTGCPDVCHRNPTSLSAAAELRSLHGWGSSYFGQVQADSRECSFSAPTSVQWEVAAERRCPVWTHHSLEGSVAATPMLSIKMQSPLSPWPLSPIHGQQLRQRIAKGWEMSNLYSHCQEGRKGHLVLPCTTRRTRYLLCPAELPGLWRYKIFSNKKKLDPLPGAAITFILMTRKDGFDPHSSHTSLIASSKPTSTRSQCMYQPPSSRQAGCQANQFDLTDFN